MKTASSSVILKTINHNGSYLSLFGNRKLQSVEIQILLTLKQASPSFNHRPSKNAAPESVKTKLAPGCLLKTIRYLRVNITALFFTKFIKFIKSGKVKSSHHLQRLI